jgi:hypothetical protein
MVSVERGGIPRIHSDLSLGFGRLPFDHCTMVELLSTLMDTWPSRAVFFTVCGSMKL